MILRGCKPVVKYFDKIRAPPSPNSSNCFAMPMSYVISPHLIGLLTHQFVDADLLIDVDNLVHRLVNAQVFILEIWGQTADL
jgi:hypothetical protein